MAQRQHIHPGMQVACMQATLISNSSVWELLTCAESDIDAAYCKTSILEGNSAIFNPHLIVEKTCWGTRDIGLGLHQRVIMGSHETNNVEQCSCSLVSISQLGFNVVSMNSDGQFGGHGAFVSLIRPSSKPALDIADRCRSDWQY